MQTDLREMMEHFNNFYTSLKNKEELKAIMNSEENQMNQQFESLMSKQKEKWINKVQSDIKNK